MGSTLADTPVAEVDVKDREPRLRADARRNRDRIIAAAREIFVEHGADAPLDEVARRAGVGNATLYRHFADRGELAHRVVLSVTERITERGESAAAEETDAFTALRRFIHGAAEEKIGALCTLLSDDVDKSHPELLAARARLAGVTESLMERAREQGRLRTDVGSGDLVMAIMQLTRPLPGVGCTINDRYLPRYLDLLLDGFRAIDPTPLSGCPVTLQDLEHVAD
ncbi:TetR/AcrR family transcriptional regulator [Streptomyces sp. SID3343]|uniref:TetR/AcrR family transcriptional regulator n=1 Tax=Streptomyces sp. SID3343 TaxID=2690260 RepID=UPI00136BDAC3|nr:TetR/AcrR family transcriptional regulator [Streptomyces sp. SID3343]MYW02025.1 TetR family transcriptional regulator [Streptomyces sp. SID3343]